MSDQTEDSIDDVEFEQTGLESCRQSNEDEDEPSAEPSADELSSARESPPLTMQSLLSS